MPRNKPKRKKSNSPYAQNMKKVLKERLPNEFYSDYISIIKNEDIINRNNKLDAFLQDFVNYKIDLYTVEKIFNIIDNEFDKHQSSHDDLRKKSNIFYSTLVKLLPLCESKNKALRDKLIRKLFGCLCLVLEPMTTSYLFSPHNDFDYFETYDYIFEKIEWYNDYIEEYYNLLQEDASSLIKSKISENWRAFFDTLDEALNCTQQVLIFCQYSRLSEKKYSINKKSIAFIDTLMPTLSLKKNEAIIRANQLIASYKTQISEVDNVYSSVGFVWYPFFSQLYSNYNNIWLQKREGTRITSDNNIIDIDKIKNATNIYLTYNKTKPSERDVVSTWSNIDYLTTIITYLNDYANLPESERSKSVISMYSELCLQTLTFIRHNNSYNNFEPQFVHKTACALFKKIYTDILEDLIQIIEKENIAQQAAEYQELSETFEKKLSLNENNTAAEDTDIQEENILAYVKEVKPEPHVQETNKYEIQHLKSVNESELQSPRINHKQIIISEQSRFEKEKQEEENVHKSNLESLLKTNSSLLEKIKSSHQKELSKIQEEHNKNILEKEQAHKIMLKTEKENLAVLQKRKKRAHKKELKRLRKLHETSLNELDQNFKIQLEKMCETLNYEKEQKSNEHEKILSHITSNYKSRIHNSKKYNLENQINLSTLIKSGHQNKPINQLNIPPEKKFILSHIRDAGIEFYIIGGWVRDKLLNVSNSTEADFDIIINAEPSTLQNILKWEGIQPSPQSKLVIFGNIDFWCEPWSDLTSILLKKDLFINTFICDLNGKVYDLLGAYKSLNSGYLIALNESNQSFKDDPVRMLRFLRFSVQLNKKITAPDQDAILKNGHMIKTIALGVYLKNISRMFLNQYGINCYYSMSANTLLSVFPFLNQNDILYLFNNPQLYNFIPTLLNKLITSQAQNKSSYSVLCLIMLIPILRKNIAREHINIFIQNNFLATWSQEKHKILNDLKSHSLNENILWSYIENLYNNQHPQKIYEQQIEQMMFQYPHSIDRNIEPANPLFHPCSVTMNYHRQCQIMNESKNYDCDRKMEIVRKNSY